MPQTVFLVLFKAVKHFLPTIRHGNLFNMKEKTEFCFILFVSFSFLCFFLNEVKVTQKFRIQDSYGTSIISKSVSDFFLPVSDIFHSLSM